MRVTRMRSVAPAATAVATLTRAPGSVPGAVIAA